MVMVILPSFAGRIDSSAGAATSGCGRSSMGDSISILGSSRIRSTWTISMEPSKFIVAMKRDDKVRQTSGMAVRQTARVGRGCEVLCGGIIPPLPGQAAYFFASTEATVDLETSIAALMCYFHSIRNVLLGLMIDLGSYFTSS